MNEGVIVIVDLGYDNCPMIKKDVESFGAKAVICEHDAEKDYLDSLGEIKGFILCGGSCKNVNGFRPEASEAIYDNEIPTFSVDHASWKGVDLFTWPKDDDERKYYIENFLKKKCNMTK